MTVEGMLLEFTVRPSTMSKTLVHMPWSALFLLFYIVEVPLENDYIHVYNEANEAKYTQLTPSKFLSVHVHHFETSFQNISSI